MTPRTELMSPAGHWPQLHAAVEAGADAVYFGLKHFSARAKVGFELQELPSVMQTLHRRSVKGYVTFNTLIFDHEMEAAEQALIELAAGGVDAVIVQDIGMARLIRDVVPDLPIHGSTQMSITSAEGAELARSLGCSRVVLARELSLADIRKIAVHTTVELETFVHGALCVSYSGQCFSSEAWGGRSANRGQCAQACRLDYELIVDGNVRDLGAARYLLSPGDLMALEQVPDLVAAGVSCLKIEGRYKDAAYVALTTQAYRRALDEALAHKPLSFSSEDRDQLEQIYSRGLGPYFISGTNHQQVVQGRAPRHRGLFIGKVVDVLRDSVVIDPERAVERGEGLVFDAADRHKPEGHEEGGFVYDVRSLPNGHNQIWFGSGALDFRRIAPGDWVWRSLDPKLERKVKVWTAAPQPVTTRPLSLEVRLRVGEPVQLTGRLLDGQQTSIELPEPLTAATKNAATVEFVRGQLERLGGTPFHLGDLHVDLGDQVFVPASVLNLARRQLLTALEARQTALPVRPRTPMAAIRIRELQQLWKKEASSEPEQEIARVHALVRTPEQLVGAIQARPASITLDYLELYGLRTSVEKVREAGLRCRVASPRILKPSEQNIEKFLLSLEVDLLVRSGGLLQDLTRLPVNERPVLDGDFSLNAANLLSAATLLELGIHRLCPTHDLNAVQIIDLARQIDPARLEVLVLHHLPIFHMEHCVFCRFMSNGTDHTNCGHPCEKHRLAVRDASGRSHPVLADVGCRNTVFNAELQSATEYLDRFQRAGLRDFRVEFVHQTTEVVRETLQGLASYCAGTQSAAELDVAWRRLSPAGTTTGSLFVPRDFKKLVQLNG